MPRVNPIHLARLTLVTTLGLIGLGGVVHSTGSSLACPDWPLCRGTVMPPMVGGILFEHSHRLLALAVLVLVFALPFSFRARPAARKLAWIGAALVVVQALLGATTVLLRLPPLVSIAHLLCATTLLAILLALSLAPASPIAASVTTRLGIELAIGALFAQIGLGAIVRHLGIGLVCGTDPVLCAGDVVPQNLLAWVHVAHRVLAIVVASLVVLAARRATKDPALGAHERRLSLAAVGLVLLQVALGMLTVMRAIDLALVTTHLVVAELLLLCLLGIRYRLASSVAGSLTRRELGAPADGRFRRPHEAPSP